MSILSRIRQLLFPIKETNAQKAYDLWAAAYDNQPGNLVLDMDAGLFAEMIAQVPVAGKSLVDAGCGTGRHWPFLLKHRPGRLIGYDVSAGMLEKLKDKFPTAEVYQMQNEKMPELADQSCDLVISTLALAHMPDSQHAIAEWNRVLKPGGDIVLTDYHPTALAAGGKRTFKHEGKLIAVKNYQHPIAKVHAIARQLGFAEIRFAERIIDESVRDYYAQQNALHLYEQFKGVPMIYGIHLKKADGSL